MRLIPDRLLAFIAMVLVLVSAVPVPGIKVPPAYSFVATVRLSRESPNP